MGVRARSVINEHRNDLRSRCPNLVPALFIVRGGTIRNIPVIAEKQGFGPDLGGVLLNHNIVSVLDPFL